jgi:hypothetical protein
MPRFETPQASGGTASPWIGRLLWTPLGSEGLAGWVALEHDAAERDLLFVVPADSEPLVGRSDVRVSTSGARDADLILRLAAGCWLRASDLAARADAPNIEARDLARSLERLRALGGEPVEMAQRDEEEATDAYAEWLGAVVVPARRALERWSLRAQREATALASDAAAEEGAPRLAQAKPRWAPPLAASSPDLIRDVHSSLRQPERGFLLAGGAGTAELRLSTSPAGLLPWIRRPEGGRPSTEGWSRLFAYYPDGTRVFASWEPDEGQPILASRSVLPWGEGGTRLVLDGEVVGEYWIAAQDFS